VAREKKKEKKNEKNDFFKGQNKDMPSEQTSTRFVYCSARTAMPLEYVQVRDSIVHFHKMPWIGTHSCAKQQRDHVRFEHQRCSSAHFHWIDSQIDQIGEKYSKKSKKICL
jgi:hypothetical protein